jgi:predicted AAA+ superfamily ATPase
MPNENTAYDSISLLLDKIIKLDLPMLGSFSIDTLNAVKKILFAIAENDVTSLTTLERNFHINRLTISNILDALEKTEVLIKIPVYGSNMTAAKKPNKYLFMSPAIRMSFFYITGMESTFLVRQGKLLEDLVGSHLYREFILKNQGAIRYDSEEGGADFILQILNKRQIIILKTAVDARFIAQHLDSSSYMKIVLITKKVTTQIFITLSESIYYALNSHATAVLRIIEVGLGDKDKKQILNTMEKMKCRIM